jgi:alpha-tubulin suppressor-like RCC1 family protein
VVAVACIAILALAADADATGGTLMAWGNNYYGTFGNGTSGEEANSNPTAVKGITTAVEVGGGEENGLALLADGTVMTWGGNFYGGLGNGSFDEKSTLPFPVPGIYGAVAVAAGFEHSLVLLANGTVLAWGTNYNGQLGIGNAETGPEFCTKIRTCSRTPVQVHGLSNVIAIAAAQRHSYALLADGTVMGWGEDIAGQQGDGIGHRAESCECVDHPVAIPGVRGAVSVAAGLYDGKVLHGDGSLTAWGGNSDGALGLGTTESHGECSCLPPVAVPGVGGILSITSGGRHTDAIHSGGQVSAWGGNSEGVLGLGFASESGCYCVPTPTTVPGLSSVHASAGSQYATVRLLDNGSAVASGLGKAGQVGDGTSKDALAPTPVKNVSGASGVGGVGPTFYALIGPSQKLTVDLAGSGTGTVGTRGLICPLACSASYPQGQTEILRPEAAAGSGFAGFSGDCSGSGICPVQLNGDVSVTATFGPAAGTRITKARIDRRRKKASFAFTAPGAITGYECKLIRPTKKTGKPGKAGTSKKAKRKKPKFASCTSTKTYEHLKPGRYKFEVRALDSLGADAKPAIRKFRLTKPHRRKR